MHHRVALALEETPHERVAELALHWRLAGTDDAKAAMYSARAGRRALDSLAPAEAAKLFTDALDLLGPVENADSCRALIGLGEAQQLTGNPAYRRTLLHATRIASALGDADLAAAAALANTRGFMSLIGELDDERVDAIGRAVELDDRSDARRTAQLLALQSQELLYEHDRSRRQALATEAIALARDIGDPRVRARVLQHAFHGLWGPDKVAVRTDLVQDLLASAQAAEDSALEFWAHLLLFHVCFETGDFAQAKAVRDRLEELATALAQPTASWVAQLATAALAALEGDLVAGEQLGRQALELGNVAGQPDALQVFGELRAFVRVYQGRGDAQLIELSRVATDMYPRMAVWPASTAQYEAHFGNRDVARSLLEEAVASGLERVGWDTLRLVALSFYADAASRLQAGDAAALVHGLMAPWGDQFIWGGALGYGHVRLWLGVAAATMGRHDEADEQFGFACRFHDDNGIRLWSARAHLGWAESLAARGDRAQAQEHAARALELARAHGYGLIEGLAAPIVGVEPLAIN